MLGILTGAKKAFKLTEVRHRAVPCVKDMTISSTVQKAIASNRLVADYLPNPTKKHGYVVN